MIYVPKSQNVFLFFLIYNYSRKIKERNTKPKIYPVDQGILGLFDNDEGKSLENIVLIELIRRKKEIYYYKTNNVDIDFVIRLNNNLEQLI